MPKKINPPATMTIEKSAHIAVVLHASGVFKNFGRPGLATDVNNTKEDQKHGKKCLF